MQVEWASLCAQAYTSHGPEQECPASQPGEVMKSPYRRVREGQWERQGRDLPQVRVSRRPIGALGRMSGAILASARHI